MARDLNISLIIGLVDRASGGVRALGARVTRELEAMDRMLQRSANLTFVAAAAQQAGDQIVGPLRQAAHGAALLQGELTEVAIVSGQSSRAVAALRPELRRLAYDTAQPLESLTQALGGMTAKGLSWEQATAALPAVARMATATRSSVADVESLTNSLIKHMGIAPDALAAPYNMLAAAANAGGFEVRDMAAFFAELAPSMAKVDTGTRAVATLGAALQVVRDGAGSAGQAATQMTDLLEKMFALATELAFEQKFGVDLPAALGPRVQLLSRLRVNTVLYDLPTPTAGAPGRARKYGPRLGNTAQWAAALQAGAGTYTLNLYGRVREVVAVERLVMLKTLRSRVRVVWVFRKTQWVALVSTDLTLTLAQIVEYYGARWKIEAGFREIKQEIGSAETQTRNPDAVTNHLHFCMAATTIAWIYGAHLQKAPPRRYATTKRTE